MSEVNAGYYRLLALELENELQALAQLVDELAGNLKKNKTTYSHLEIAGFAHWLDNFYTGIEDIMLRIASHMERTVPSGEAWHKDLLNRMGMRVPSIRPPVFSRESIERLDEYRRFRHRARHIYRPQSFDWSKMLPLVEGVGRDFPSLQQQVTLFIEFVLKLAENLEEKL